jgi:hypothetical protein
LIGVPIYIQSNISKAKQCIGWVKRNVISRNAEVMVNIYKSLIRPHLEYSPILKLGHFYRLISLEKL